MSWIVLGRTKSIKPVILIVASSMTPVIRTLKALLLCGVVALGHAPAWMHVADCDHGCHLESSNAVFDGIRVEDRREAEFARAVVPCSHGCCQHVAQESQESRSTIDEVASSCASDCGDDGHHHHDSDSCSICQSLAVPAGVTWQLTPEVSCDIEVEISNVVDSRSPESSFQTIPRPRGPPTLCA